MTDKENPYSFKEWLTIQKVNTTVDVQRAYMEYLKNWYLNNNKNFLKTKEQTKQEYLQLIKDLSYLFNQEEKDRFLKDINYDNPEELVYAIPYFAKKLKEIAKVLNAKRNSIKNSKLKYNLLGSNDGLESLLYEYLLRSFTKADNFITQVPASPLQNLFPDLSSVKDNFFIEIEELYDTDSYLDSDPSVDIKEYVDVNNIINEFPYENLSENEIIGLLNTRFLPRVARNPLSKIYEAYLTSLESGTQTLDAENLIDYQIAATEKYLGDTLYGLTAIRLKDLNLPDQILNLNLQEGNNWFIWPSGSKSTEKEIGDNIITPIQINDSNFVNSGATGGSSLLDSDLIFTDKNGRVEGAWLRGPRSLTNSNTARIKIDPQTVKEFIYPYVGFNLTPKGANWSGHTLNDDSFGIYSLLDDSRKKELLNLYYTETLPNSSLIPFYLNQSTLVDNGAKSGEFTFDSDVIIKRKNFENNIQQVYSDNLNENSTEAAFLYKFQRSNIPLTLGLNQIYWPIKEFDPFNNIQLTLKQNHSIPVALTNLDVPETMSGAVAGFDFNDSDVIYKLNSRTSEPIEAAWLGSNSIQNLDAVTKSIKVYDENAIRCAKYIDGPIQPSLALRVNSQEKISFVWNDVDTPANEVFKFYEHAPNCPYGQKSFNYYEDQDYQNPNPLKDLNHWTKCSCKSVYYSPIGHAGEYATDYNTMADMLFEDPDALGQNFNFDNWSDTRGYNYKNSPQFGFYKLEKGDSDVGWGEGYWKTGPNKSFILKTGRRYTYVRSSLRKDSTSSNTDFGISPYYIVNYSYKELRGVCNVDPSTTNGCYDLIIALDISNSQKLSVDETKQFVTQIAKTLLAKSTAIQIGLIVFNKDVTLLSYLTDQAAGIEFNLYSYVIPDTSPQYKTDISNALTFSEFLLTNNVPPLDESNSTLSDLCSNLDFVVSDDSNKSKTLNNPQNCAKKILIVSDGESNINANTVIPKANELKSKGVEIYAVDIGLLSYNNNIMETIVSDNGYYFNLQKYINEGGGDVFSLSQRVAAVLNGCSSIVPSWNRAIRNSNGAWVGVYEPSDMVLNPGDYLIYVHREGVNYIGEDTESGFNTPAINFAINVKLNGWDYEKNSFDSNNIGSSYGARPYWAVSNTTPNENFNKETNHFGGNVKFVYDYVPVRQPDISNIILENGDFIQYFRKKNTSFIWNQPISLTTILSDYQWNKLSFTKDFYNLDEILKNNEFNYYGFSSEEPSDLLLESYSEFKLSRYNYFARNSFDYNQNLYFINRCDNTFVVFASGEVLKPVAPHSNLLNVHYPTVGVLNVPKNLVSTKQYGKYLNPINLGVSYYRGKGYTIEIDKNQISLFDNVSAEKIFFDINKYGSRNRGLTKKDQYSPVVIKSIDNRWLVESFNSGEKRGTIINARENQKFTPYQTSYEILNKNNYGLSRQDDKLEFWTENLPSTWNDEKNYPLTYRKELMASTYELRKRGLLSDLGEMTQWRTDIFGNEYGLFKGDPTPYIIPQEPIVGQNSTFFGFGAATGALTNQHWIHYVRWSSEFDIVETSQLIANGNLLGDATIENGGIKLTRALTGKTGHIYYKTPVYVKNNLGQFIDWSIYFVLSMGGGTRADGLGLILQSNSVDIGGGGGGMGFLGIPNSIGVFFDTFLNYPYDSNNNHIEIDANGSISSLAIQPNVGFDLCGVTGISKFIHAWVDYSATTETIKVYASENSSKPSNPLLTKNIKLEDYLILS